MDRERIEIENEILDKLSGRFYLMQELSHKKDVIFNAFLEVYNSPRCKNFVKSDCIINKKFMECFY